LNPIEKVIDDIYACDVTISSSLHWIIVSHAYGIPSYQVKFKNKLYWDGTKFSDYFLSVGITPYKPTDLSKNKLSKKKLIKLVEDNHFPIFFDRNKLLDACPFITKKQKEKLTMPVSTKKKYNIYSYRL